jgi:hypothetical protein
MLQLAEHASDAKYWAQFSGTCHCHLLVWERESIVLPVADRLDLGASEGDVFGVMNAAEWLRQRWLTHRNSGFSKALSTRGLLDTIAQQDELRSVAVACNSSLRAIVDGLVDL